MEIKEEWKTIKEYPNYMVSNMGNVKSLKFGKEKLLKQGIGKNGYYKVPLCEQGKMKTFSVHRLVAKAFIPNPNNYPCVNHKSEVKTDNRVDNLEWVAQKQNCNYGTHNEKIAISRRGKKHTQKTKDKIGKAISIANQISIVQIHKSGLIIGVYDSVKEAGNELGINRGDISSCLKGKLNSAGGYKWKYLNELKKAG